MNQTAEHDASSTKHPSTSQARHSLSRLILLERTGRLATAFAREPELAAPVRHARTVSQCWELLEAFPASIVVVELDRENVDPLLLRLTRFAYDFPRARLALFAARELADHELLLREAGASDFITSPRQLGRLIDVARSHLKLHEQAQVSLEARIWSTLPWPGSATS